MNVLVGGVGDGELSAYVHPNIPELCEQNLLHSSVPLAAEC
jgi:hypothetical protein